MEFFISNFTGGAVWGITKSKIWPLELMVDELEETIIGNEEVMSI
jgi:hypothetical protein